MPGLSRLIGRRAGPIGLALTAVDLWKRLTPEQRKQLVEATRKHGPRVAATIVRGGRRLVR